MRFNVFTSATACTGMAMLVWIFHGLGGTKLLGFGSAARIDKVNKKQALAVLLEREQESLTKKGTFLYLMTKVNGLHDKLCRLNIDEFCKNNSPKPRFEVVHNFNRSNMSILDVVKHTIIGSNVYMVGGQLTKIKTNKSKQNLDVYSFDPTDPDGPFIRLSDGAIDRRLIDPKDKNNRIVVTLEEKTYVLETGSGLENLHDHMPPLPLFEVFDPLYQSWKNLPHPPWYDRPLGNTEPHYNFFGGNKLVINTKSSSYIFDTHKEKWEVAEKLPYYRDSVEFEGFLFVVSKEVVAYKLDSNGIPKWHRVLHELQGIFCPFLSFSHNVFFGKYDRGRMLLVYKGQTASYRMYLRVAVFRISISNDLAGNVVLFAEVEAAEFYFLGYGCCSSPFLMVHDYLDNHYIHDEKDEFGTVLAHSY